MNTTDPTVHTSTSTDPDPRAGLVSVLIVMAAHLDLHDLPLGCGVTARMRDEAEVILPAETVDALAAKLIAWADTLTAVTIRVRRFEEDDDRLLLALTGRAADGVTVRVHCTPSYADYTRAANAEIEPCHEVPLALDELRAIANTAEPRA